jgi:glutathione-specific gamma-glutamylcyclotransferase
MGPDFRREDDLNARKTAIFRTSMTRKTREHRNVRREDPSRLRRFELSRPAIRTHVFEDVAHSGMMAVHASGPFHMDSDNDPFRHHPALRNLIVDPQTSAYRAMSLELLDERMRAIGAPAGWRRSDDDREESRRQVLIGREDRDLWVFAYGSLMWDPGFRFSEVRSGLLRGYHRRFCLRSVVGRGTPDKPGLMAGLDRGGECRGLAFRIDGAHVEEETQIIWRREMVMRSYAPEFVPVETAWGGIEALAFIVDPAGESYRPGMSLEETARFMATGAGLFGSSLAYLERLIEHFATLGIEDAELLRLRDLSHQVNAL